MSTRYVALLRAVNVGGRRAPMQQVARVVAGCGATGVRTFLQSGNIVLEVAAPDTPDGREALRDSISAALGDALGFGVELVLRTPAELAATIEEAPFPAPPADDERHYLLFCSVPPGPDVGWPVTSRHGDMTLLGAREADVYCRLVLRAGRPGNPADLAAATFGGFATARFLHTTVRILAAAGD